MTGVPAPPGVTADRKYLPFPGQVGQWEVTARNHSCLTARLHGPLEDGPAAYVAVLSGPGMGPLATTDPDVLDTAALMLTEAARWLRAQQDVPVPDERELVLDAGAAP